MVLVGDEVEVVAGLELDDLRLIVVPEPSVSYCVMLQHGVLYVLDPLFPSQ